MTRVEKNIHAKNARKRKAYADKNMDYCHAHQSGFALFALLGVLCVNDYRSLRRAVGWHKDRIIKKIRLAI